MKYSSSENVKVTVPLLDFIGAVKINGSQTIGLGFNGTYTKAIDFTGVKTTTGNFGVLINSGWIDIAGANTFGAKLMLNNSAATVLYGVGIRCRTGVAGGKAIGLNVAASSNVIASGGIQGIQAYCQITTNNTVVIADSTDYCTALYSKTLNAAANDGRCSSLWVDEGSTIKATTHFVIDITMNGGAIILDSVFHIYGGTQTAALLFDLEGGCGVNVGSTKTTPTAVDKWLAIKIDSVAHYIPCYISKTA